jgi:hypothetical protein
MQDLQTELTTDKYIDLLNEFIYRSGMHVKIFRFANRNWKDEHRRGVVFMSVKKTNIPMEQLFKGPYASYMCPDKNFGVEFKFPEITNDVETINHFLPTYDPDRECILWITVPQWENQSKESSFSVMVIRLSPDEMNKISEPNKRNPLVFIDIQNTQ